MKFRSLYIWPFVCTRHCIIQFLNGGLCLQQIDMYYAILDEYLEKAKKKKQLWIQSLTSTFNFLSFILLYIACHLMCVFIHSQTF